ncbi:MAG: VanW family protein, partial [bacterium]|nr:VanW family protein [bacterium]
PPPGNGGETATTRLDPSRLEAISALADLENSLALAPIRIEVSESSFSLLPAAIGFDLDENATLDAALADRSLDAILEDLERQGGDSQAGLPWSISGTIDEAALDGLLDLYESALVAPDEGGIDIRGSAPVARYPQAGFVIDRAVARNQIVEALLGQPRADAVRLPTIEVQPVLPRAAVDAALEEASVLLAGPVTLTRTDPAATLHLDINQLGRALTTEVVTDPEPGLRVAFDRDLINEYLNPLRSGFEAPPRNAYIMIDDQETITYIPGYAGALLDVDLVIRAIEQAARRETRRSTLPLQIGVEPEITAEELAAMGPLTMISEFTTRHNCCQPRVQNIHLFADVMDNVNLLPGETLSLNETVGERTLERGFLPAPTIIRGEIEDQVGGGVSQFASTFYNAVFWAGLEVIDHKPHSYYFSRYPMGIEATVSWPVPDLVFRNDTDAPLVIKTSYTRTSITVRFYGNNSDREVTASVSAPFEPVPYPTEYVPNPEVMPWDPPLEVQQGADGWSVTVTRDISFTDGTTSHEEWKVRYRPWALQFEVHPCQLPEDAEDYTGEPCPAHPDFPEGYPTTLPPDPDAEVPVEEGDTAEDDTAEDETVEQQTT